MCNQNICKTTIFIKKAIAVHGDAYNYSKVDYKKSNTKITIICNKAGHEFEQVPNSHLRGIGCPVCAGTKRKTTDQFVRDAITVHGDAYDYNKVNYKNNRTKVIIICKAGHEFEQMPHDHLYGKGCHICADTTKTTDQFIRDAIEVHGDSYDYSMVNYKNSYTKITIICKKSGHKFEQTPSDHLTGYGCAKCSDKTKTTDQFVRDAIEVHDDAYDYSMVNYKNTRTKVTIICKKAGHVFEQIAGSHSRGDGCPKCAAINKSQNMWLDIIGVPPEYRNTKLTLTNGKLIKPDAYDPVTNTIYEFHGDYWHGNPALFDPMDINKNNKKTFGELYKDTIIREHLILQDGYKLVTIWEKDFLEKYNLCRRLKSQDAGK